MDKCIKEKEKNRFKSYFVALSSVILYTALVLFLNVTNFTKAAYFHSLGNFHYTLQTDQQIDFLSRYTYIKEINTNITDVVNGKEVVLKGIDVSNDIVPFE